MVGYVPSRMPAELTRMWMGESKARSAESKRDLTSSGSETLALTAMARGGGAVAVDVAMEFI